MLHIKKYSAARRHDFVVVHKMGYYIPWISSTSQVICHIKNEMMTTFKNNIVLNFENRMKAMLNWRLINKIDSSKGISQITKEYLFKIVNSVYGSLTNQKEINVNFINKNISSKIDTSLIFSNENLEEFFKEDRIMINIMLTPDLNSRYVKGKLRAEKEIPEHYTLITALKNNSAQCLKYLYIMQRNIQYLELTIKYKNAIELVDQIPKENKQERKLSVLKKLNFSSS